MFEPTPGEMLTAAGVAELEKNLPRLIEASIPPEPGLGAVVIGKAGRAYQRLISTAQPGRAAWWPVVASSTAFPYGFTWPELLATDGPVLLVQDARPEAVNG